MAGHYAPKFAPGRRPPLGLGPRKLTLGYTTDFATGSLLGTGRTHTPGPDRVKTPEAKGVGNFPVFSVLLLF